MAIAVIPARYSATRLPGKPLVSLAGKPMIQRVWERARQAKRISRVIIATDDERIMKAAAEFGAEAVMTRSEHRSGTERVAEVAVALRGNDDEVFIGGGEAIYRAALPLAHCVYLTTIHFNTEGDTYFPELGIDFHEIESTNIEGNPSYSYLTFERR